MVRVGAVMFWLLACGESPCLAQNVGFIPGDAFFPTSVSVDKSQDLRPGKHQFPYRAVEGHFENIGPRCGVLRLTVTLTQPRIDAIMKACQDAEKYDLPVVELRDGGQRRLNSPMMFIYPKAMFVYPKADDGDIRSYPLFLKCNEGWMDQDKVLGIDGRFSVRLAEFVPSMIETSWRNSKSVPALPVEGLQRYGSDFALSGTMDAEWVGVICSTKDFEEYRQYPHSVDLHVYVLSGDVFQEMMVVRGDLRSWPAGNEMEDGACK